jgi:3-isopropylmalate dehydrogenase
MPRIAVLPGDGIGVEITRVAVSVLETVASQKGLKLELIEGLFGGAAYDRTGRAFPQETVDLVSSSDAVLLGAIGGPKWDHLPANERLELAGLLQLRKMAGAFANLRPAAVHPSLADASSLRREVVSGIDILVVRELTGGIYFGQPRYREPHATGTRAVDTLEYSTGEIQRVVDLACRLARGRRGKVTSVDKANVLETSRLWREVAASVASQYPDVQFENMLVDNCAMQLVRRPSQFDVLVTENMFGDILSDEAAMLTGSIGMLPSASIGGSVDIYEPIHGSAPDIAGKNIANPIGTVLSAAMLLRHTLGLEDAAKAIEGAVSRVLEKGYRTADIAAGACQIVGTDEMGRLICEEVQA